MARILLGAFAGVVSVGFFVLLAYDLVGGSGDGGALPRAAMAPAMGAASALLFARRANEWSLAQLRGVEIAIFATLAVYLAVQAYGLGVSDLQAGGSTAWHAHLLRFTLLMLAYAVFTPNAVGRAGVGVGAIGLTPVLVAGLIRARHPELRTAFDAAVAEHAVDSALLLGAAAVVAIVAAAVIDRYLAVAYASRSSTFYELHELIGSGGMGEVWKASHRTLARPAAVKLIRGDKLDSTDRVRVREVLQRFEREARAAARLRSPHTVAIYDAGVTGDGNFFYAMEYLEGLDLEELIVERFGPVPAERAVHLLMQACDSLADAHEHGMTHRDIKPANLHLSRRGPSVDFVKLLDFGLVQVQEKVDDSAQLTADGITTGTPAYMAPEMAVGSNGVDARADIYALGCVAYWLLTGTRVFEADTGVALIVEHVKTPPTPPSQRTDLLIPEELERIVMKCLEKDPADRFASARELAAALAAVRLPAPWTPARAEEWWKLHMPPAAAARPVEGHLARPG